MRDPHAPHDEFVNRLESNISRQVRQRNALAESSGWLPRFQWKTAIGIAALIVVSMGIGGAVVAAAYEAQQSEQRDQLSAGYQRRLQLARDRLMLAEQQLRRSQQQWDLGLSGPEALLEARLTVAEAQSSVKVLELQLEEIRLTSREPGTEMTSPVVAGRDFLSERWKIEITVPQVALELEQRRLAEATRRVEIGVSDPIEAATIQARLVEMESGVLTFQRKLDIRQRFLKGEYDATMADLRVIEAGVELRQKALKPKLELAERETERLMKRVEVGTTAPLDVARARVKLFELRTQLADLDVQLAVVQKQIAERKIK